MFKAIWNFFFHACEHEYELIDNIKRSVSYGCTGHIYVSRCKKCGKITSNEIN